MLDIQQVFDSKLATLLDGFVYRNDQVILSENIASVMQQKAVGLFEAGTGTGKTLSYLVPAFLSDEVVIVSTGTKNLQDQLFFKDVPLLSALFPQKKVALLKGRGNYLCPYRLKRSIKTEPDARMQSELMSTRSWAAQTKTGDLTEIMDPEENAGLLGKVSSTRDNCLGSRCPEFDQCPVYRARERAKEADIVVVNHHLLFADMAQREDSMQNILPRASAVIVDEAHQIASTARQFFGQRIGSGQFVELIRDCRAEFSILGNDDPASLDSLRDLEKGLAILRKTVFSSQEVVFDRWCVGEARERVLNLDFTLTSVVRQLAQAAVRSEGLAQCSRRVSELADNYALLTETEVGFDTVHWIDRRDPGFVIHLSPVSIATELSEAIHSSEQGWVFTSATLSVDDRFDYFTIQTGVTNEVSAIFESPFDYLNSVLAFVPAELPLPSDENHTRRLVQEVVPFIETNAGRTFFLFTSHQALRTAAELLATCSKKILVQGTMSKARLLTLYGETPGCVLLATQSFWEGVDVRGSDLRCLIIDKLPFPSPGDPLFSAECAAIDSNSGNSFSDLSLPRAVLSLKQGFGRLIREENSKGLFILGDPRINQKSYGRYLKNNLPEMSWTESHSDAIDWLKSL